MVKNREAMKKGTMTVEFKFNNGEKVWVMNNNRPEEFQICNVHLEYHGQAKVQNAIRYTAFPINGGSKVEAMEWDLFRSKADLIASL